MLLLDHQLYFYDCSCALQNPVALYSSTDFYSTLTITKSVQGYLYTISKRLTLN